MVIFNSYVKLPEGSNHLFFLGGLSVLTKTGTDWQWCQQQNTWMKPKWKCISNCVGWIEMGNDVQALSFLKARLGFRKHLFWKGTPWFCMSFCSEPQKSGFALERTGCGKLSSPIKSGRNQPILLSFTSPEKSLNWKVVVWQQIWEMAPTW